MDEHDVNESRIAAILAGLGSLPLGSRHILIRELIELCEPAATLDALIVAANHPETGIQPLDWITAGSRSPAALATAATQHLPDDALATLVMLLEDECGDGGYIAAAWWTAQTEVFLQEAYPAFFPGAAEAEAVQNA